jgi:hypothetical protein
MHLKDEWFDLLWEEEEKAELENALYLFGRILKISSFSPDFCAQQSKDLYVTIDVRY